MPSDHSMDAMLHQLQTRDVCRSCLGRVGVTGLDGRKSVAMTSAERSRVQCFTRLRQSRLFITEERHV